ncbi:MAG TPA: GAF domain-containing protein, partial [Caldithrix abyssi]|nr:GAF domain-containing protein [Caldithrix abyssi]
MFYKDMKIFDIISLKKSDRAKLRSLNDIIDILFLQKDIKKLSIIDINNLNIEGVEKYQSLIMKHLYDIFNPDIACFYKRNINENVFEKFIGFPDTFWQKKENKEKFEKWPINKGAIGKVVKTCKPVIINNPGVLIKKGEFVPFQKKMKSEILVPIVINDFVVSIIILSYFKKNKIDIVLREYINTVCSVLGIIFKNEYDKKNKERIIDFLKSVSSHSSENIDKILKNYYDSMKSLMKIHIIEYYLYNKIDDTLVLRGYYPLKVKNKKVSSDDFDLKVFLYKDSLSGEAIYQKKAIIHTNIINDSKFNNKKFAKRFKLNWFISVPILVSSQEVIGVINIWPDMPYELYDFALSEYIELSTYSLGTFIKESYV